MIRSIVHLTDLSREGAPAFRHALRLALFNRCQLHILHAGDPKRDDFPRVRELLERWGYLEPGAHQKDVFPKTGVPVVKANIYDENVVDALSRYLDTHPSDLIVAASQGRAGLMHHSISAKVAQTAKVPALIFGPNARSFVDAATGNLQDVKRILVPVDHDPAPDRAIGLLDAFAEALDVEFDFDFVHIGSSLPSLPGGQRVRPVKGPVIDTILLEAQRVKLMAMPMAGRNGLVDALRGSTTERVINEVTCPVLVIPIGS